MSKFDEVLVKCAADLEKIGTYDPDLLKAVTKGLGPSIYIADAQLVAASDKKELERLRNNFLIKKLGLPDTAALDEAISKVVATYDSRRKWRPVFYYLLVKELGQEKAYEK